jgi:hypothetical protein
VGCSSDKPLKAPETVLVSGKVILPGGNVLSAGRVTFKPTEFGTTDQVSSEVENGAYTLKAVPGNYRVVIELATYKSGSMKKVSAAVPGKYLGNTSPLLISVQEGKIYDLRLTN